MPSRFGSPFVLAVLLLMALAFHPESAYAESPENKQSLFEEGQRNFRQGQVCLWSGLALVPVSLLAAIPVWYDGAFGITAADPGFAIVPAVLSAGLMHAAIPLWGFGAEKMERAVLAPNLQTGSQAANAWDAYNQSWYWVASGSAALAAAVPFAALAGLQALGDKDDDGISGVGWTAITLGVSGASLMGFGLFKQYLSAYRFHQIRSQAESSWPGFRSVWLAPQLQLTEGGGLRPGVVLATTF